MDTTRYQNVAVDRQLVRRLKMLDPFAKLAPIVKKALADEVEKLERGREREQVTA